MPASTSGIKAGKAFVSIEALDRITPNLKAIFGKVTGFLTRVAAPIAGLLSGISLGASVQQFVKVGDEVAKLGQRLNTGAEFLSALGFAAEQSDTSLQSVGQAIFRMNRRIANATTETGPAVRALEEMGFSAERLNALPTDEKFLTIADALSSMADQNRAAQLGFEIFGDNFRQIEPLLESGRKGIEAYMKQAEDLGLVLSDQDAKAAAEASDAFNALKRALQAILVQTGAGLAPILTDIANRLSMVAGEVAGWISANRGLIETFTSVDRLWNVAMDSMAIAWIDFQISVIEGFDKIERKAVEIGDRLGGIFAKPEFDQAKLTESARRQLIAGGRKLPEDFLREMGGSDRDEAVRLLEEQKKILEKQLLQDFEAKESSQALERSLPQLPDLAGIEGPRTTKGMSPIEALQSGTVEAIKQAFENQQRGGGLDDERNNLLRQMVGEMGELAGSLDAG